MKQWEQHIRQMTPYVPGEQPKDANMIKLNTNENPYPPSPMVQKLLLEECTDTLRRYPDTQSTALVDALASYYQVDKNQIFIGVGSDDVLAMSFMTFFNSNLPILFADVTYSFYDVWAKLFRIPFEKVPLDSQFHIQKELYYKKNGGIVIANPNAPTSIAERMETIEDIIMHNQDSVVIIDEAYVDFGGESMLPLIQKYDNLLVVQTFSKSRSLAGLRIGYAIGNPKLIQALETIKNSYNSYTMNTLSIQAGAACVKDVAYYKEKVNQIIKTRDWVKQELEKLGFVMPESHTNFLFMTHPKVSAKELFEYLKQQHIFVRYFEKERIDNYLRVTVGTRQEMELFLENVNKMLNF